MYDVHGIGLRIAEKRKSQGLTQEALAEKLGISAQAVSKWETGLGFPDLTLLPALAEALGMNLEELFGRPAAPPASDKRTPKPDVDSAVFPAVHEGLDLVAVYGPCAVYADQEATSSERGVVTFPDGSEADLKKHHVINRGKGRILIVSEDELEMAAGSTRQHESEQAIAATHYVFDLNGLAEVKIVRASHGEKGGWKANGSMAFMKALHIEQTKDTFTVRLDNYKNVLNMGIFRSGFKLQGELTVFVPDDRIAELDLTVRGAVSLACEVDIKASRVEIKGGAQLNLKAAGTLDLNISGAGRFACAEAKDATIKISGAGKVGIDNVSGEATCHIAGAGSISLSGELDRLTVKLSGAGTLDAAKLSVGTLDANMQGIGTATIGRVRQESSERLSPMSSLHILARG